jgi:alanine dehydrogenase
VGVIGSGTMARTFLQAICQVRPIDSVKVFSRSKERREAYAAEMAEQLGISVTTVDEPVKAVRGADIVATATDAMHPVFETAWLEPGMHIVSLGPREISEQVAAAVDVRVRQGDEEMPMEEHGQFRKRVSGSLNAYVAGSPEEQERLPKPRVARLSMRHWPVYTDIISGAAPGRTSPEQVTLYHTIGNWGLQFAAVGGLVYRKAKERGVGMPLPTEWFLQNIRN